jgi:PBP1b-binding outer membrane lipoprotein LpoB
MQTTKAKILAIGLGAVLVLGGCTETQKAAKDATEKGTKVTQQAKDKATEMTKDAEKSVSEAADMASSTFNDATEITADTADSFKEKSMAAYASMEERFNAAKDSLDENVVQELQGKFTSLKAKLDALGDKTGTELLQALGEIRTEGAELAADLKAVTGKTSEATPQPTTTP